MLQFSNISFLIQPKRKYPKTSWFFHDFYNQWLPKNMFKSVNTTQYQCLGIFEGFHPVARRGITLKQFNLPCFSVIFLFLVSTQTSSPQQRFSLLSIFSGFQLSVNSNSLQMENLSQITVLHHGGKFVVFSCFLNQNTIKPINVILFA